MSLRPLLLVALVVGLAGADQGANAVSAPTRPVTAIAIVGDSAINPLHAEFRTRDGRDPVYPAGMPTPVRITLPRGSTFEDAVQALADGPLGAPRAGTLYAVAGTRLLIYARPGSTKLVTEDRAHGTAAASSAVGLRTGTSPDSLVVWIPDGGADGYGWLAGQRWIDVASTSVYSIHSTPGHECEGAAEGRAVYGDGGLLFSSSGNTYDYYEAVGPPNALPETFQVGGTDGSGRTWLPPHPEEESPFFALGTVVRPYEVGARFSFPAASGDSIDGTQPFGGTSGATPTVAGYAAELVAEARRLVGDRGPRSDTAMARGRGVRPGPLADGVLTRDELVDVLHRTATPHEAPSPARYALEGYGAVDAASQRLAVRVLRGEVPLPVRADEDGAHAAVEDLRATHTSRCP